MGVTSNHLLERSETSLSAELTAVLTNFQSVFTAPTWAKVQVLVIDTLLARGRCTVMAMLCQMGLSEAADFSVYHQVLNRTR